mmetsp:Transcript_15779/g.37100  ORF Transcript_15779/g.37100 Transcript_15779/m.37100 type:complete len:204 (+) Transcript_15779:253-864(+)
MLVCHALVLVHDLPYVEVSNARPPASNVLRALKIQPYLQLLVKLWDCSPQMDVQRPFEGLRILVVLEWVHERVHLHPNCMNLEEDLLICSLGFGVDPIQTQQAAKVQRDGAGLGNDVTVVVIVHIRQLTKLIPFQKVQFVTTLPIWGRPPTVVLLSRFVALVDILHTAILTHHAKRCAQSADVPIANRELWRCYVQRPKAKAA